MAEVTTPATVENEGEQDVIANPEEVNINNGNGVAANNEAATGVETAVTGSDPPTIPPPRQPKNLGFKEEDHLKVFSQVAVDIWLRKYRVACMAKNIECSRFCKEPSADLLNLIHPDILAAVADECNCAVEDLTHEAIFTRFVKRTTNERVVEVGSNRVSLASKVCLKAYAPGAEADQMAEFSREVHEIWRKNGLGGLAIFNDAELWKDIYLRALPKRYKERLIATLKTTKKPDGSMELMNPTPGALKSILSDVLRGMNEYYQGNGTTPGSPVLISFSRREKAALALKKKDTKDSPSDAMHRLRERKKKKKKFNGNRESRRFKPYQSEAEPSPQHSSRNDQYQHSSLQYSRGSGFRGRRGRGQGRGRFHRGLHSNDRGRGQGRHVSYEAQPPANNSDNNNSTRPNKQQ